MKLHLYFKAIFVHYQGAERGKNRILWSFPLPSPQDSCRATEVQAGYHTSRLLPVWRENYDCQLQRELHADDARQSCILAVLESTPLTGSAEGLFRHRSGWPSPVPCCLYAHEPGRCWQLPGDSTSGPVSPLYWSEQPAPGTQAGVSPTARTAAPPGTSNLARLAASRWGSLTAQQFLLKQRQFSSSMNPKGVQPGSVWHKNLAKHIFR